MAVVPNTNPRVRQAVIEIPRYLNNADTYQFHHRFVFVRGGREEFSPVFTEEIVAHEIPYVDNDGRITEVRLLWSVNGWNAPNWTQAKLEGLKLTTDEGRAGHDREGEGIADDAVATLPRCGGRVARPSSTRTNCCGRIRQFLRMILKAGITIRHKTIM
jgi:hypothetical protein